jgi:predicted ferric reductase
VLFLWPAQAGAIPQAAVAYGSANTSSVVYQLPVTVGSTATNKFKNSWSWYISRASGLIAAVLLALLMASGVGLLTGLTYRILEPLPAWAAHRAIGLSFGITVLVHIFSLLFDKYIGFDMFDLLVPFKNAYKPTVIAGHQVGLNMALGIIAFYLILAIVVTSLLWVHSKPRPWHIVHYLSYIALGLVFVHGLFMGTDLKKGAARVLWVALTIALLFFMLPRLRRAWTIDRGNK